MFTFIANFFSSILHGIFENEDPQYKCSNCGSDELIETETSINNSFLKYKCRNCGEILKVTNKNQESF